MLMGQSKVARVSDIKDKPVQFLYNEVLAGALNPTHAHQRFLAYNNKKLELASLSADGHRLNYFLPRHLGGLGMNNPNISYISQKRALLMTENDKIAMEPYCVVNGYQERLAAYSHHRHMTPFRTKLFKPVGQQVDEDPESNNFPDHPDWHLRVLVPADCPMPPQCREVSLPVHYPNWMMEPMSTGEEEGLTYNHKGVRIPSNVVCKAVIKDAYQPLVDCDIYRCHDTREYWFSSDRRDRVATSVC